MTTLNTPLLNATLVGHPSAVRAKRVIGTSVRDAAGKKIGRIEDIVLDKQSSNILFTVVSFGGFLGMGQKFHPLPWSTLDYDADARGYVVNFSKQQLQAAPAYSLDELIRGDGNQFREQVYDYYNAPRYWS